MATIDTVCIGYIGDIGQLEKSCDQLEKGCGYVFHNCRRGYWLEYSIYDRYRLDVYITHMYEGPHIDTLADYDFIFIDELSKHYHIPNAELVKKNISGGVMGAAELIILAANYYGWAQFDPLTQHYSRSDLQKNWAAPGPTSLLCQRT